MTGNIKVLGLAQNGEHRLGSQVSVYKRESNLKKKKKYFQITVDAVNETEQGNLTGSLELEQWLPWLWS